LVLTNQSACNKCHSCIKSKTTNHPQISNPFKNILAPFI
jgi:hypothetical protein